jgi:hypothetical protein
MPAARHSIQPSRLLRRINFTASASCQHCAVHCRPNDRCLHLYSRRYADARGDAIPALVESQMAWWLAVRMDASPAERDSQ